MRSNFRASRLFLSLIAGGAFLGGLANAADSKPARMTYDEHIRPIFREKCFACHNPDKKSGGLDLTIYSALMQGGSSGSVIEPGDPSASYLYNLVAHESEPYMPPASDRIPDAMLKLISDWITAGAPENAGSKVAIKKPAMSLTLSAAPSGRPEGPPPMPAGVSLEPVLHTDRAPTTTAIATNPWSNAVAVAGVNQVVLYDAADLQPIGILPFPEGIPQVLKFSRNGELLLAGGGHDASLGLVVVWEVRTGKRLFQIGDELDTVLAADISSDHRLIALGGPSKMVRVYSIEENRKLFEMKKHTDWIYSVAFSPDGVLLATGDRNGGLVLWEAMTGQEYLVPAGHNASVTAISWRPDSNAFATASEDGSIKLWEVQDGRQIKSWGAHGGGVSDVQYARDGRIVSCGRDKTTKLWNGDGAAVRTFEALPDIALRVAVSDETGRVIAGDWTGVIRVWNAEDGKALGELTANPPTLAKRLATAQSVHAEVSGRFNQAKAVVDKAQADLQTAVANVKTATDAVQAAEAKLAANQKETAAAKAAVDQLAATLAAATKQVAELTTATQALKAASDAAAEALKKLPDDEALKQGAAKAVEALTAKQGELAAATKQQADVTAAHKTAAEKFAALEAAGKTLVTEVEASKKKLADLQPIATKAQEQLDAAAAQFQPVQAEFTQATATLQRWTDAIAAEKQRRDGILAAFNAAKAAADKAEAEYNADKQAAAAATAAREKSQASLKEAETTLAGLTQQYEQTKQARAAADKLNTDLTAAQTAMKQTHDKLTKGLPVLKEAVEKVDVALQHSGDDAAVKAAAASLKEALARRTAEFQKVEKELPEVTKQLAAADANLKKLTAEMQTQESALATAQTKVAETKAAAQKAAEVETAAQQKLKQAEEAYASAAGEALLREADAKMLSRVDELRASLN